MRIIIAKIQETIRYLQHKLRFVTSNAFVIPSLFLVTLLRFRNLGHKPIKYWDELFHAIVARNTTKHFLMPTFYDQPYLPYDYKNWTQNHIWLHKPPIALWQIAISYYILGVNTLALRLPSAIFSILAVFITYMLGCELYNRKVGIVAAFLHAANPLMMNLVHGYVFSDHINIAVVFWVELSCYLLLKGLKTGKTKYYIWSGVAQGLGYLSKSYLCAVSFGIAGAMLILVKTGFLKSYAEKINWKKFLIQPLFSILVAAPWVVFCLIKYTKEFIHENNMVLAHLYTEVEIWEKAWDHHLFTYIPGHYPYWYLIIFVSIFFLIAYAIKERSLADIFVSLWIICVLIPLSASTSKVPAGADIAISAFLICFAAVFYKILKGKRNIATISYFGLIFSVFFLSTWPFHLLESTKGTIISYIQRAALLKRRVPSLYAEAWIIYQALCYLAAFALFWLIYMGMKNAKFPQWREKYIALLKVLLIMMIVILVYPISRETVRITHKKPPSEALNNDGYDTSSFEAVGQYIQENLPVNSALLLESPTEYEPHYIMFYADRSAYHLKPDRSATKTPQDEPQAITIRENGGMPYLISTKEYNCPLMFESPAKPYYRLYSLE